MSDSLPESAADPNSDSESGSGMSTSSSDSLQSVGHQTGNPDLSPLEGGRWRPVSPDELLRKPLPSPESGDPGDDTSAGNEHQQPAVQLERRQELEHKLKANPTDLAGFLELAAIYRAEHRPVEAKRLLKQAAQIFPDDDQVTFQFEEAVLARSIQQFREVSDLAQRLKTPEAERELERSRSDWACRRIEVCNARLQRDPSQLGLRLSLAEAHYDADLFEEAYSDAGRLLELDEYSAQAHFIRARCQLAMGNDLPAMKELRAVAMSRAVIAPTRLRHAALKLLCDLSDKLSFNATGQHYRELLRRLEQSESSETH